MSDRITCPGPECGKSLAPTTTGKYRQHLMPASKTPCDYGGTLIPEEDECQPTPSPSPDGAQDPVPPATPSTPSSPNSPEPEGNVSTASAPDALPGVEKYAESLNDLATEQLEAYKAKVEVNVTPFSQPAPHFEVEQLPIFSQPAGRMEPEPDKPMSDFGREIAASIKQLFYQYNQRQTSDNRSAQTTMGPSEIGTPCERRIAMSLMKAPAVNSGGDGFAAWFGTQGHRGLAEMFEWANAGSGRYAVETPLTFPSAYVPKGTGDLLDRSLLLFLDHKFMGTWSLNKLRTKGPSETYRVQVHTYAYGARQRGERVEHVAIVGWPRQGKDLNDLYVWTEPYNPKIASDALARVERIAKACRSKQDELVEIYSGDGQTMAEINTRVAADFPIAPDCTWCPFYLSASRDLQFGCNGKR